MKFRLMRVAGESMMPALPPGRLVIVDRRSRALGRLAAGQLVAARPRDPESPGTIVKRIAAGPGGIHEAGGLRWRLGENEFFLLGDAPGSRDSRAFGPVSRDEIVGRVRPLLF